jgi:hypothetical protein
MRFELVSAFVIGILLPALETYRRGLGHWTTNITTMFEDYVAGLLLLIGAFGSYRKKRWGLLFLMLAWAYVTGMMGGSFWYQLEDTIRGVADESNNLQVVVVKFVLWAIAVISLVLSFKNVLRTSQPENSNDSVSGGSL